jgi:hypothetical protein
MLKPNLIGTSVALVTPPSPGMEYVDGGIAWSFSVSRSAPANETRAMPVFRPSTLRQSEQVNDDDARFEADLQRALALSVAAEKLDSIPEIAPVPQPELETHPPPRTAAPLPPVPEERTDANPDPDIIHSEQMQEDFDLAQRMSYEEMIRTAMMNSTSDN